MTRPIEQRRYVVGRDHVAPPPRRSQGNVTVTGRDVEHALAGANVERLAELLADDLQGGAHDRIVAGRPGALLARLHGLEVDLRVIGARRGSRLHSLAPFLRFGVATVRQARRRADP